MLEIGLTSSITSWDENTLETGKLCTRAGHSKRTLACLCLNFEGLRQAELQLALVLSGDGS